MPPAEVGERFPLDRDAVARTVELAERLEFDLTQELGYRYPDFSDGEEPAIVQLRHVCERAFADRYGGANCLPRSSLIHSSSKSRPSRMLRAARFPLVSA